MLVLVLVVGGDCRLTKANKREERGARVWHLAVTETETDCGNYTSLYREEKPSELCTEVSRCRESIQIYNDHCNTNIIY